jgi:hypothetical protein
MPQDPNLAQPLQGLDWLKVKLQELMKNRGQELSGPDPTAGVMPMMIPTAQNLPRFAEAMRGMLQESKPLPQAGRGPIDALKDRLIQTYMSVRYPQRAALPNAIKSEQYMGTTLGEVRGARDAFGYPGKHDIIMSQNLRPNSTAQTLGHEMQHVVDFKRNPKAFADYPVGPGYNSDSYLQAYQNHPTEIAARQAGDTTSKGLGNLMSLINQAHPDLASKTPGMINYGVTDVSHSSDDFISMMYDWLNKGR